MGFAQVIGLDRFKRLDDGGEMSKVGRDNSCAAVQSADARGEVDWGVDGSGYREVFVGGYGCEFGLVEVAVVPGVVLLAASEVARRGVW